MNLFVWSFWFSSFLLFVLQYSVNLQMQSLLLVALFFFLCIKSYWDSDILILPWKMCQTKLLIEPSAFRLSMTAGAPVALMAVTRRWIISFSVGSAADWDWLSTQTHPLTANWLTL